MSKVTQEEHDQGALGNGPLPMVASTSDPRTSPTARPQKNIDFSKCQAKSKVEIHICPTAWYDGCTAPSPLCPESIFAL